MTSVWQLYGIVCCHIGWNRSRGQYINVWSVRRVEACWNCVMPPFWPGYGDAKQTHGRGAAILNRFLSKLAEHQGPVVNCPTNLDGSYSVCTEILSAWKFREPCRHCYRGHDDVVFIEVKIGCCPEGEDQIDRYLELAQAKARAHPQAFILCDFSKPRGCMCDRENTSQAPYGLTRSKRN